MTTNIVLIYVKVKSGFGLNEGGQKEAKINLISLVKFALARKPGDSYAPFMRGRFVPTQPLYQRPPTQIEFVGVEEQFTCI